MVEAKTLRYGCRQQENKKQFGRNRGIPKTQRVLASTNISRCRCNWRWDLTAAGRAPPRDWETVTKNEIVRGKQISVFWSIWKNLTLLFNASQSSPLWHIFWKQNKCNQLGPMSVILAPHGRGRGCDCHLPLAPVAPTVPITWGHDDWLLVIWQAWSHDIHHGLSNFSVLSKFLL